MTVAELITELQLRQETNPNLEVMIRCSDSDFDFGGIHYIKKQVNADVKEYIILASKFANVKL